MPNLRARELRWNMTEGEQKLWLLLRRKRLSGFRFRRQATIGPYIADFFCPKTRLIVELDGEPHTDEVQMRRDIARTRWLEAHGCRVIRFWNLDVFKHPTEVVETIYDALTHPPSGPSDHLPPQGGEGRKHALSHLSPQVGRKKTRCEPVFCLWSSNLSSLPKPALPCARGNETGAPKHLQRLAHRGEIAP